MTHNNSSKNRRTSQSPGLFKGVLLAYSVLVLHVVLLLAVGLLVVFFSGVVTYLGWILLGGALLILLSGYLIFRRLKAEGNSLRQTLNSPMFNGRSVEVNLIGGLASFKLGQSLEHPAIGHSLPSETLQLESPDAASVRELTELARLLENNLISLEEFNIAKKRLFKTDSP